PRSEPGRTAIEASDVSNHLQEDLAEEVLGLDGALGPQVSQKRGREAVVDLGPGVGLAFLGGAEQHVKTGFLHRLAFPTGAYAHLVRRIAVPSRPRARCARAPASPCPARAQPARPARPPAARTGAWRTGGR